MTSDPVKTIYSQLANTFSEHSFYITTVPEYVDGRQETIDGLETNFISLAQRMATCLAAFIEFKNLPRLLTNFEKELGDFDNFGSSKLFKGDYDDEAGQFVSDFLIFISKYMEPFEELKIEKEDSFRLTDFKLLENILRGSKFLCDKLKKPTTTETEISSVAKTIIEAVFPSVQFSKIQFVSTAKCYNPDILIPYLHCAIEYKYATTRNKLVDTIDQIHTDVRGYSSEKSFKIFYAVFCVKAGIITDERFYKTWDEKQFPPHWRPILVQGF